MKCGMSIIEKCKNDSKNLAILLTVHIFCVVGHRIRTYIMQYISIRSDAWSQREEKKNFIGGNQNDKYIFVPTKSHAINRKRTHFLPEIRTLDIEGFRLRHLSGIYVHRKRYNRSNERKQIDALKFVQQTIKQINKRKWNKTNRIYSLTIYYCHCIISINILTTKIIIASFVNKIIKINIRSMNPFPCSVRTNEVFLISSLSCPCRLLNISSVLVFSALPECHWCAGLCVSERTPAVNWHTFIWNST